MLRKEKGKGSRTGVSEPWHGMISVPEGCSECSVSGSHIHGEQGPLCRVLYKHPGRGGPATMDLLSKQRKNSRRIRNQWTSPELHGLVRTPERHKPGVLIPSPATCSFSWPGHLWPLWCLQGVHGTKDNYRGLVFLTTGSFAYRHTPSELGCPQRQCPLLALGQLGGCSDGDCKVTFAAEMQSKMSQAKGQGGGHTALVKSRC